LILLVAWLLWRFLRRSRPVVVSVPPSPPSPQTALEEALAALEHLQQAAAFHQEQAQAFYLALEVILKRFLEALYHQPVSAYTDHELAQMLAQLPVLEPLVGVRQALTELRERSLIARFARGHSPRAQMQRDLDLMRDFVRLQAEALNK
jgi:hypothetical protein